MTTKRFTIAFLFLLSWSIALPVYAAVTIDPDFKGSVVITAPDGTVSIVNAGETVPNIPPGSSLEVMDGEISVSATGGDSVNLTVFGHTVALSSGTSANLNSKEDAGVLKVNQGNAEVTTPEGDKSQVDTGAEYKFKPGVAKTTTANTPTEAGELLGTGIQGTDNINPPDSRSIESSPSA